MHSFPRSKKHHRGGEILFCQIFFINVGSNVIKLESTSILTATWPFRRLSLWLALHKPYRSLVVVAQNLSRTIQCRNMGCYPLKFHSTTYATVVANPVIRVFAGIGRPGWWCRHSQRAWLLKSLSRRNILNRYLCEGRWVFSRINFGARLHARLEVLLVSNYSCAYSTLALNSYVKSILINPHRWYLLKLNC
jgi:hypothetical protein